MDFVNKAFTQIADLLKQMTPGTRVVAALLFVGVVVSLFYLLQYEGFAGNEYLLNGRPFTPSELTAIEAAFAKAKLGKSIVEGSRIRIPKGKKELYLAALADSNALPADFFKYLDEATAADNPFVSSRSMEMKHRNAKQKELALIISRMRGIQTATVQFDEVEKDGFRRQKQKTAMVAVQTIDGSLDENQIKAIRNVVSSSYAGLDRRNITITDMTGGLSYAAVGEDGTTPEESVYASHKEKFERDWRQKIMQQLAMIPNVIVGVNVELNPELQHSTQQLKIDTKPLTVSNNEFTRESSTTQPTQAGRPGAVPNGVGNQPQSLAQSGGASGPNSTNTESKSEVRNVAGHEQTAVIKAGLVPSKVTASIDIPRSYFVKVWRERQTDPAAATKQPDNADIEKIATETTTKVRETVRNLLPTVAAGTDPYPHVVVSAYTDFAAQPVAAATLADNATIWMASNWQTVGMIVLGLIGMLMVRGIARQATAPLPPTTVATADAGEGHNAAAGGHGHSENHDAHGATEEAPATIPMLKKKLGGTGPTLKDELRGLVKEDPDAAATILRAWIGDAA